MENKAFKRPQSINPVAILALVAGFASAQPGSSNRACVTGALEKDRHAFQHRFNPLLLCSSHKSRGIIFLTKSVLATLGEAFMPIPTALITPL
jgi:hypothetical protein